MAKGYWMTRSKHIQKAKEAVLHAGEYAYHGRKLKKRSFKKLWIIRLNAALREKNLTYSGFMHMLKKKNVMIDRKILAQLVVAKPAVFDKLVSTISDK